MLVGTTYAGSDPQPDKTGSRTIQDNSFVILLEWLGETGFIDGIKVIYFKNNNVS